MKCIYCYFRCKTLFSRCEIEWIGSTAEIEAIKRMMRKTGLMHGIKRDKKYCLPINEFIYRLSISFGCTKSAKNCWKKLQHALQLHSPSHVRHKMNKYEFVVPSLYARHISQPNLKRVYCKPYEWCIDAHHLWWRETKKNNRNRNCFVSLR